MHRTTAYLLIGIAVAATAAVSTCTLGARSEKKNAALEREVAAWTDRQTR